MKNEISFVEILNLVDKVVAIYEFNDVLNLDDLKKYPNMKSNEKYKIDITYFELLYLFKFNSVVLL